jgi:tight adherence protein B
MGFWIIPIAVFLGVGTLVLGVALTLRDRKATRELEDRLDTFAGLKTADSNLPSLLREPIVTEPHPGLIARIGSPRAGLQRLITQADLRFGPGMFMVVSAALSVIGTLMAMLFGFPAPMLPLGAGVGLLPLVFLYIRRRGRMKKFGAQLPDALELIARALRAGHSLASGLNLVSQEMPPPIATECQRTYEEQNFGVPLDDAMRNLGERVPNMDLRFFITAVSIQRQTGGDLAEILDKLGYVIRERFKLFGQVAALTAEGRLSGWILNGLPILLLLALLKINPGYVMLLFTDPMGRKMLMVAGVLQILGAIAIQKIVNIRV